MSLNLPTCYTNKLQWWLELRYSKEAMHQTCICKSKELKYNIKPCTKHSEANICNHALKAPKWWNGTCLYSGLTTSLVPPAHLQNKNESAKSRPLCTCVHQIGQVWLRAGIFQSPCLSQQYPIKSSNLCCLQAIAIAQENMFAVATRRCCNCYLLLGK